MRRLEWLLAGKLYHSLYGVCFSQNSSRQIGAWFVTFALALGLHSAAPVVQAHMQEWDVTHCTALSVTMLNAGEGNAEPQPRSAGCADSCLA